MNGTCVKSFELTFCTKDFPPAAELESEVMLESSTAAPLPVECEELYFCASEKMNEQEAKKFARDIGKELADSLKPHLPIDSQSLQQQSKGWTAREKVFGVIAVVASLVAIYLGIFHGLQYIISAEVNRSLQPIISRLDRIEPQFDALGKRFDGLEKRMGEVEARALPAILSAPLPKDKQQRSEDLQQRSQAIEAATKQNLPIYPDTPSAAREFRIKLASLQPTGGTFWKAAGSIINYESFIAERSNLFIDANTVIKEGCAIGGQIGVGIVMGGFLIRDCRQQIDNGVLWENGTFRHMLIVYNGGELHLKNVDFEDCIFAVAFPQDPSLPVKRFAQSLLSAARIPASLRVTLG